MNAQTVQEALNLALKDLEAWKAAALAAQAERDALAAQVEVLTPLARRCLWGAIVWNDHNFDPLHTYCRESTAEAGVHTVDQANALLESTPTQCLAEIKAQAVEGINDDDLYRFVKQFCGGTHTEQIQNYIEHRAESIRKGEL